MVLVVLLFLSIFLRNKKEWVFLLAFIFGLVLDVLFLRPFSMTPLFFILFVLAVFLYGRKFETKSLSFVFLAIFLGEIIYLTAFGYEYIIQQAFMSSFLAILLFKGLFSLVKRIGSHE